MCPGMHFSMQQNLYLLFTIKIIFVLMLFTCLLVMLVRQRVMIKILKEIRDKK
ncbi:MAG: hypothetical protein HZB36_06615 [Candidatus Omnitrophica bacterium]|nr:hypothetical protein [Candidatus Omnitrophota bacterium]